MSKNAQSMSGMKSWVVTLNSNQYEVTFGVHIFKARLDPCHSIKKHVGNFH